MQDGLLLYYTELGSFERIEHAFRGLYYGSSRSLELYTLGACCAKIAWARSGRAAVVTELVSSCGGSGRPSWIHQNLLILLEQKSEVF